MDTILGSNVSKDYNKIQFARDRGGLPSINPNDPNLNLKEPKRNTSNPQDIRPPSQDR